MLLILFTSSMMNALENAPTKEFPSGVLPAEYEAISTANIPNLLYVDNAPPYITGPENKRYLLDSLWIQVTNKKTQTQGISFGFYEWKKKDQGSGFLCSGTVIPGTFAGEIETVQALANAERSFEKGSAKSVLGEKFQRLADFYEKVAQAANRVAREHGTPKIGSYRKTKEKYGSVESGRIAIASALSKTKHPGDLQGFIRDRISKHNGCIGQEPADTLANLYFNRKETNGETPRPGIVEDFTIFPKESKRSTKSAQATSFDPFTLGNLILLQGDRKGFDVHMKFSKPASKINFWAVKIASNDLSEVLEPAARKADLLNLAGNPPKTP
ncbi:MAG TPA: hypothetical protein VI874_03695, partial [Candidatus Norongarragalinales archaeon]|nr:hypothetical protein [Candidatus Norongarragalinales archaeon]